MSEMPDPLVVAAADAARKASTGEQSDLLQAQFAALCLQAIASQQSTQRRHELARQAAERAGAIATAGLQILQTIFLVAL